MIAIYLNTRIWGGVDVLTARLACHLRDRNISFCIIEARESRIRDDLRWVRFIEPDQAVLVQDQVTHVIAPSISKIRDEDFPWSSLGEAKFLTWAVQANDAFRCFFPFSGKMMDLFGCRSARALQALFHGHYLATRNLISLLVDSNALAVMDGATTRALEFYYPSLSKACPLIPIPSLTSEASTRKNVFRGLSIGYFGRVDGFKWTALKPFITSTLSALSKDRSIEFHAVAEGDYMTRLSDACAAKGIKFVSHGYMQNLEARRMLAEKTDVVLAMGTSALDIAGAGHPCIILDPAVGHFTRRQKKFRFVHETDDFTLGEFRDAPGYIEATRSFEECISDDGLMLAARYGKEYVRSNHDPVRCFDALLAQLYASEVTVSTIGKAAARVNSSFNEVKRAPVSSMISGI